MEQPKENTLGEYRVALELRKALPEDSADTPVATSKDRLLAEAYVIVSRHLFSFVFPFK